MMAKVRSIISRIFRKQKRKDNQHSDPSPKEIYPISFDQGFLLYNIYQWLIYRPYSPFNKTYLNAYLAIILNIITKRHRIPMSFEFSQIENRIFCKEVENLTILKIREKLMLKNKAWVYELTDEGKTVVEKIIDANYQIADEFDFELKKFFTLELRKEIDNLISERLRHLPEDRLVETAIALLK